jgi:hypothetical protein
MKNYRIFAGILALALVFGLIACEGPVGPAGAGTPGVGTPGAATVSGTVSAQVLQALLNTSSTVYVDGATTVTGPGVVTIPAGKTLKVIGDALELGNTGIILNATTGTLDLSDDDAELEGESAGTDPIVLLPSGYTHILKVDDSNLTVAPLVTSPDFTTDDDQAIQNYTLGDNAATVIAGGKTLYVFGTLSVNGNSAVPSGQVVALNAVSVSGTIGTALSDITYVEVSGATLSNTATAAVTLPASVTLKAINAATGLTLGADSNAITAWDIGDISGAPITFADSATLTSISLGGAVVFTSGGSFTAIPSGSTLKKDGSTYVITAGAATTTTTSANGLTIGAKARWVQGTGTFTIAYGSIYILTVNGATFTPAGANVALAEDTVIDGATRTVTLGGDTSIGEAASLLIANNGILNTNGYKVTNNASSVISEFNGVFTAPAGATGITLATEGGLVLGAAADNKFEGNVTTLVGASGATGILELNNVIIATTGTNAATLTAATPKLDLSFAASGNSMLTIKAGGYVKVSKVGIVNVGGTAIASLKPSNTGTDTAQFDVTGGNITIVATDATHPTISSTATTATLTLGEKAEIAVVASKPLAVSKATLDIGEGTVSLGAATATTLTLAAGTGAADVAKLLLGTGVSLTSAQAIDATGATAAQSTGAVQGSSEEFAAATHIQIAAATSVAAASGDVAVLITGTSAVTGNTNKGTSDATLTVSSGAIIITPVAAGNSFTKASKLIVANN